jgi:hypothetical protein
MPASLFPYVRRAMSRWGANLGIVAGAIYATGISAWTYFRPSRSSPDFIWYTLPCCTFGIAVGLCLGAVWGFLLGHIMAEITEGRFDSIHVGKRHERWMVGTSAICTGVMVFMVSQLWAGFFVQYRFIWSSIAAILAALAAGHAGWRVARSYAKIVQTEGNVIGTMA